MDDLLISTESAQGFIASSDNGMTVVMDTTVTEELKAEGVERELISKIQTMRKEAGFEVVDRITVNYTTADEGVKKALYGNLKNVVLADSVTEGEVDGFRKELDINGASCVIILNKV
jgi:isoleucyl-tRNA synthetase